MSDPCYASPSSLRSSSVSMSACIGGLPLYLPFLWIALFCIILRHLRVQLAEKTQSTEPKEDRFLPANVPVHPRATVSWQPPPTDAGMFAVTVFSTQRYTGSIGRQWHPHQISRHCIFDDTPCMQLTLWHTHQHTHTHTHTHTHSLRSPPSTLHTTLLVSRTLSTRINLRWLIKRLLKIRLVLGGMETNNAEPGSKHSITCEETDPVKMYKTDWKKGSRPRIQFVSRTLLILCILHRGSPAVWKWMAVNKCVKICTVPWPESLPRWASASAM